MSRSTKDVAPPPDARAHASPTVALDGCRIGRALDSAVEIVEAAPRNRSFPDRVNESLGICMKTGPAHDVRADGRTLRYPADAICIRAPGTVWSTAATGLAGFLSIDVEPSLLPEGGVVGAMRFAERGDLPDVPGCAQLLRSDADVLCKQTAVTELVDALLRVGLLSAPDLDASLAVGAVDRARELLTERVATPPTLQELADMVGGNRFSLLREFRRRVGVPPHAFVLRLRIERARTLLARGADISWVSLELGFADQSHLTRVFKRVVGLSPAAYRREMRPLVGRSISFKT
jgi:AraC-like DNA-binding protein